jgi:hypothetical protein
MLMPVTISSLLPKLDSLRFRNSLSHVVCEIRGGRARDECFLDTKPEQSRQIFEVCVTCDENLQSNLEH